MINGSLKKLRNSYIQVGMIQKKSMKQKLGSLKKINKSDTPLTELTKTRSKLIKAEVKKEILQQTPKKFKKL
jgi:hypothetical protein